MIKKKNVASLVRAPSNKQSTRTHLTQHPALINTNQEKDKTIPFLMHGASTNLFRLPTLPSPIPQTSLTPRSHLSRRSASRPTPIHKTTRPSRTPHTLTNRHHIHLHPRSIPPIAHMLNLPAPPPLRLLVFIESSLLLSFTFSGGFGGGGGMRGGEGGAWTRALG